MDLKKCKKPKRMSREWYERFMKLARFISEWSRCYSRKAGAVIVSDKVVVSMGFNGPPMGVDHCDKRHPQGKKECPRHVKEDYISGSYLELCPAQHAEENAITFAGRDKAKGATMFVYAGALPCPRCAGKIINAGIVEVVCDCDKEYYSTPDAIKTADLFRQAGIKVMVCRFKKKNGE